MVTVRVNPALASPFSVARGNGPYVYDLDDQEYVDMCVSCMITALLRHNHPRVCAAIAHTLDLGVLCAYEIEHHVTLLGLISEMVPYAQMIRFAGSGTETVKHDLRLRSAIRREKVNKFEGLFHSYSDFLNYIHLVCCALA